MEKAHIDHIINANNTLSQNNELLTTSLRDAFELMKAHHQANEALVKLVAEYCENITNKEHINEEEKEWLKRFYVLLKNSRN